MKKKPKTKPKKKVKAKVKPKTRLKTKAKSKPKAKKVAKKKAMVRAKLPVKIKMPKPIGKVTHFFGHIDVAIVKFKLPVKVGTEVHFKGATTDFKEKIKSMQFNHKPVSIAKKGQEVGIKINEKVREGDLVYPVK